MRFNGSVHTSSHDQTVVWSQLITLAVCGISFCEFFVRRVQVSQRKIGHIQSWIRGCELLEVLLGVLIVAGFA